jgi:hypothetical protein
MRGPSSVTESIIASTRTTSLLKYARTPEQAARNVLVTTHACQERYCKPYISLPATGMRAVRISPDSASVM